MVSQLACALEVEGIDREVFCIYGQPQENHLEQALRERNIPIHFIGKKKGPSLSALWCLFRELDSFGPDLIHTHLYACVYAAAWPVVRRKPMLHTFHTLPEVENRRLFRRVLTRFLIRHGKMFPVAISRENRRLVAAFYGLAEESVPVVHNPVELHRFSGRTSAPSDTFRFITAGRFSAVKNQQLLLRAFAAFLEKGYDARLVMLGKGEQEKSLRNLAQSLGIGSRISYPGFVANVEEYFAEADIFVLSSHYEAQPLSVLEAMAAGLPVISTDVGGVKDIVTDNGLLVPAGDVEAMTEAMERLYLDKALYELCSANARQNALAYDIANTASGYEALYRIRTDAAL